MYTFVGSFKHTFCYEDTRSKQLYVISGDIYRDSFTPILSEEVMTYFKEAADIDVQLRTTPW